MTYEEDGNLRTDKYGLDEGQVDVTNWSAADLTNIATENGVVRLEEVGRVDMFESPLYQWNALELNLAAGDTVVDWEDKLSGIIASEVGTPAYRENQDGYEAAEYNATDEGHDFTSDGQLPTGTGPVSFAATIYVKSAHTGAVVNYGNATDTEWAGLLLQDDGRVQLSVWGSTHSEISASSDYTTGQWITIGGKLSADEFAVLLNGANKETSTSNTDQLSLSDSNPSFGYRRADNSMYSDIYLYDLVICGAYETDQAFSDYHDDRLDLVTDGGGSAFSRYGGNPVFRSTDDSGIWNDLYIDTPDLILNPNDETQLYILYGGQEEDSSTDAAFDVGLMTIDLSTGVGAWTQNENNPIITDPNGIGDPSLIYNADGSPAPYECWFWNETDNSDDQVAYYTGDSLAGLTEHADSPVVTSSDTSNNQFYRPIVTYDTVNDEYVMFLNYGAPPDGYKLTSPDGISWSEQGKVHSGRIEGGIIKEKSDGTTFYRPKTDAGSDTWYLFSGPRNDHPKTIYESSDQGDSWSYVRDVFDDSPDTWEDEGINSIMGLRDADGRWLTYYMGVGSDNGNRDEMGVGESDTWPV